MRNERSMHLTDLYDKLSITVSLPSWGKWACPICGIEMLDSDDIFETVCDNGHMVNLGVVQSNGVRETFEYE